MGTRTEAEFEELARARAGALYRSAWLLCGDHALAEDLVQETLAKVYVKWRSPWTRIDNPAAYTHTALTRTFLSHRRRRSSSEQPLERAPEPVVTDDTEASAVRMVLLDALAGLGREDRTVLVLRYLEDLSIEETAERMGVSTSAVRTRSSRAAAKLRPVLDGVLAPTTSTTRTERHDR